MYLTAVAIPADVQFNWMLFIAVLTATVVNVTGWLIGRSYARKTARPQSKMAKNVTAIVTSFYVTLLLGIVLMYVTAPKPSLTERLQTALGEAGFTAPSVSATDDPNTLDFVGQIINSKEDIRVRGHVTRGATEDYYIVFNVRVDHTALAPPSFKA